MRFSGSIALKQSIMKRLVLPLFVLLATSTFGQFISVDQPGVQDWNATTTWEGGVVPDTIGLSEDVTIQSYVDLDGNLAIGNQTILTVGTDDGLPTLNPGEVYSVTDFKVLVVRGNLSFVNQNDLIVKVKASNSSFYLGVLYACCRR